MNNIEKQIYVQIKQKNPNLNHTDIIRIQNKIIDKLSKRENSKDVNVNTRFHNEQNLRNIPNQNKNIYIPRIEHPQFQLKINRNEFEDNYQDFYQQRNEYNQQEYMNGIKKNGLNTQQRLLEEDDYRKNFIKQTHLESDNSNTFENNNNYEQHQEDKMSAYENEKELRIFNLSPSYTIDELKNSYRKLTLKHHPDRGGDIQNFRMITEAFNFLSEKYQQRASDKTFNQLKTDFNKFTDNQEKTINTQIDADKFNLEVFNKIYQDNRLENSNDRGYGDWKTTDTSETNKSSISRFELNTFNSSFENQKEHHQDHQQLINYKEPEPSTKGTGMNYSEIEDSIINDFSSDVDSNLKFTDYKQAHTNNNLININKVKVKKYKNVDDLENERSNISYQMTPQELERYNIEKRYQTLNEEKRIQNIKAQDDKYELHFNKMNKLLLNNFHS